MVVLWRWLLVTDKRLADAGVRVGTRSSCSKSRTAGTSTPSERCGLPRPAYWLSRKTRIAFGRGLRPRRRHQALADRAASPLRTGEGEDGLLGLRALCAPCLPFTYGGRAPSVLSRTSSRASGSTIHCSMPSPRSRRRRQPPRRRRAAGIPAWRYGHDGNGSRQPAPGRGRRRSRVLVPLWSIRGTCYFTPFLLPRSPSRSLASTFTVFPLPGLVRALARGRASRRARHVGRVRPGDRRACVAHGRRCLFPLTMARTSPD